MSDIYDEMQHRAEQERQLRRAPGSVECPNCGYDIVPEDCEALQSCESCGWVGPKDSLAKLTSLE
jgi:hypothetical protein